MQKLNRTTAQISSPYPIRILQFGGGNFLRGFVDWIVEVYNKKNNSAWGVLVIKPTEKGDYDQWKEQDGLFHVLTRGIKHGQLLEEQTLVKCISQIIHPYKEWTAFLQSAENVGIKYIISNTTESGIHFSESDRFEDKPPHEFPAKLSLWLYHRFRHFRGASEAACVFIPTELINQNGSALKKTILQFASHWQLEDSFKEWIIEHNIFCNTLVDRIVPGVARESLPEVWNQIGFEDQMVTQGEPYHFWAIEAPPSVRVDFPIDKIGLNIVYTDDLSPFRTIKVRILNGAHTSMVPVGYLYGIETVRAAVCHPILGKYIQKVIFEEIIPGLDMPEAQLHQFAGEVLDRFKNPFILHQLISIALNSTSKFTTRLLPSILSFYQKRGKLPKYLVFSMAAMIHFYRGKRNGEMIPLKDDPSVIAFLQQLWAQCDGTDTGFANLAENVLKWEKNWRQDLTAIEGFQEELQRHLIQIDSFGMEAAVRRLINHPES